MSELRGRTALVTGAASGIGAATAEALAREGASVGLVSLPTDDLAAVEARCSAYHGRIRAVSADVSDPEAVRAAFERVEADLGPVDAVHNNAGISIVAPLTDTTDEVWHRQLATNLSGAFYVLREAARVMTPRRRGAIVNTASELALMGQPGYVGYTATKGGILAMTRSAAAELASSGIRVNAVCPGTTRTPMFLREFDGAADPDAELAANEATVVLGRIGEPPEIAEAVAFLLSERASYITGAHLVVDGGRTCCFSIGDVGTPTGT